MRTPKHPCIYCGEGLPNTPGTGAEFSHNRCDICNATVHPRCTQIHVTKHHPEVEPYRSDINIYR